MRFGVRVYHENVQAKLARAKRGQVLKLGLGSARAMWAMGSGLELCALESGFAMTMSGRCAMRSVPGGSVCLPVATAPKSWICV